MYIFFAIFGIIFLFLDLQKTSIIKLSLSSSFLFTSIVAFKYPDKFLYQGFGLILFSCVFYFLIKTILKKEQKDLEKEKTLKSFIGKKALVIKDIGKTLSIDGIGFIEYQGKRWQAKSIDDKEIKSGKEVEIVSKENMIMNVKVKK